MTNITTHKMILLPYLLFFLFYVHNVISLLIIVFFDSPVPLLRRGGPYYTQALNPYHRD